jgi:hypothetical protein
MAKMIFVIREEKLQASVLQVVALALLTHGQDPVDSLIQEHVQEIFLHQASIP